MTNGENLEHDNKLEKKTRKMMKSKEEKPS